MNKKIFIIRYVQSILICLLALLSAPLGAEVFLLPAGEGVVGALSQVETVYEDTLTDVARRHGLGYTEILAANPGVDPWLPGAETDVLLPTHFVLPAGPRRGLVVNIAEYRLYYFAKPKNAMEGDVQVSTFPISIGRMDWATPLGPASIVAKASQPSWYPPDSVRAEHAADGRPLPRVVPPGPDNPLGNFALRLSIPGYLIHGTNRAAGIGMRVTHGCIRMYPEDIEWLFPAVSVDTPVRLINQPYKMGWSGDELLLEVHAPLSDKDDPAGDSLTPLTQLYVQATAERAADVDWELAETVYREQRGVPVVVGRARGLRRGAAVRNLQ